jgi:hypothetical protein
MSFLNGFFFSLLRRHEIIRIYSYKVHNQFTIDTVSFNLKDSFIHIINSLNVHGMSEFWNFIGESSCLEFI